MFEDVTLKLSKKREKELLAHYNTKIQDAIEKSFEDKEFYKPMVRMSGLSRWLDVSTTTIAKWQKEGMPYMVIDGVTLYDKRKILKWIVLGIFFSVITAKHIFGLIITSILSLAFVVAFVWLRYKKRKKWLETDIKVIAAKRRVESE